MKFKSLINKSVTLVLSLMLFFVVQSNAQSGTSSVRGTVQDAQGENIAGANITLRSEKGFTRTQVTNDSGNFVFTTVPPDIYVIEVESAGFKKAVINKVEALVDTPKEVDVILEVGNVTESVSVSTSTEAPINTTDASIGNTITQQQIVQLPLSSRETVGLLSLQPGVTADNGTGNGGAVNGGRSDQANVTLDGVDVNEQQGGQAFFTVLRVTPESLQEFRVTTTNANADAGRSSGAQVSLITRSGNNELHGSGYIYYRPGTFLQANNFFNNKAGVEQVSDLRKNYGGSLLGPIVKDRLFFSAFYERFEEDTEDSVIREVPLATLGQGIVRYRTNSGASDPSCPAGTPGGVRCLTVAQINAAYIASAGAVTPGINPLALSVLAQAASRYAANDTTVGDGLNTGGFRFNASRPVRNNVLTTRLDAKINDSQNVFAKYQYQFDNGTRAASRFPDTIAPASWVHPQGLAAGHIWNVSSNMVNRFTYGFTRDAFTLGGDSTQNFVSFRFIYQPLSFSRSLSRITPVHNIVDDFTWVKGNHTISTGANIRLISNKRTSFGSSFDNASTNPSFYDFSGDVVINDDNGDPIFSDVSSASSIDLRDALTAVIGRFSQFGANLQYGKDGRLLPVGGGVSRNFKTEEYEAYIQDSWRIRNSLTVNYGLRWSTSTPVYEADGLQVKPTTSLSDFFDRRVAAAFNGQSNNELIAIDLAGKANNRPGYYKQDWNNFAPAISAAWSPNFKRGIFNRLFGEGKSTIRGGFRMTYDRIGSALAVAFDLNSTLGFSSAQSVSANTFNVSTNLGPLFTGIGQDYRSSTFFTPGSLPNSISFPLQTPPDQAERIEQSLDDKLTTPYNYNYNLSYGRDLGKGYVVEVSYVGRIAKSLLVSRDSAHFNNLRDPASGQDFYSTIRELFQYRQANSLITSIPNIAWVERFLPGLAGTYRINGVNTVLTASQAAYRRVARSCSNNAPRDDNGNCPGGTVSINGRNTTDYTFVQTLWDDGLGFGNNLFVHPQYATFAAYSTIGSSDYNGLQVSFRKRFRDDLQFDVNYTYSHSLDDASGNESSGTISSGASLILNPLNLRENRGSSDFDVRHLINANFIYGLPFGKGKLLFGNSEGLADKILGGWQLTGIFRFNTGFPIGQPFDDGRWATNWNVQSNGVAVTPVRTSPTRSGEPNLFSDPQAAYSSYRNALPGEDGDRNLLREPSYIVLDAGLYKAFSIAERHKITFRLEVFNVSNTQKLTGIANFALSQDPNTPGSQGGTAPSDFGRFTQIQGKPRTVQFAIRYDF